MKFEDLAQIYIGIDIGNINDTTLKKWIEETRELSTMLVGLIDGLVKSPTSALCCIS